MKKLTVLVAVLLAPLWVAALGAQDALPDQEVPEEPTGQAEAMTETVAEEVVAEEEMSAETEDDVVLMNPRWAALTCEAWNRTPELTDHLGKWIQNDKDRGFKVIQVYRTDCEESDWVELRLAENEGAVQCIYGGALETTELEPKADYVMHANTERWQQMGAGDYGPMMAMMTRRLKFKGPMFEAMGNMGPFGKFLLLVGDVPSDASSCP